MSNVDIYTILSSKSDQHDQIKRYLAFLNHCSRTNIHLSTDFYVEKHHILPKSIFPEYKNFHKNKWNCIKLTKFQHLAAHSILAKIFNGRLTFAYGMMLSYIPDLKEISEFIYEKSCNLVSDNNLYRFQNIKTSKITYPMTRRKFSEFSGISEENIAGLFRTNPNQYTYDWRLFKDGDSEIYIKPIDKRAGASNYNSDKNLYRFQNLYTEIISDPMTRLDFCEKYNVSTDDIGRLFYKKTQESVKGWCLYDETDPDKFLRIRTNQCGDKNPRSDKRLYQFQRLSDGFITENLTRISFCEQYGESKSRIGELVSGKKVTVSNGWILYDSSNPDKIENIKRKKTKLA